MNVYLRMAHQERQSVQNWTSAAVDARIYNGKLALHYGLLCLQELEQSSAPRLDINGVAASLYDTLSDLIGECSKHLDDADLVEDGAKIDLTPLNKFL